MNINQKQKLIMYIAVRDYLVQFLTILNALPGFQAFYTALQNAIVKIQEWGEQQGFNKSGNTTGKNVFRDNLITLAIDTARKMKAYAKFTNNFVLLKEVTCTETKLKRMSDVDLRNQAQGFYDRAQANVANTATYGVTAATQTTLLSAITNFNGSIGKPRIGTTETTQATEQLTVHFDAADAALENIDLVVEIIRLTQPNFYKGYKTVRKLVKRGGSTLAVNGLVTDADGNPLAGAKITFTLNGTRNGADKVIIKKKSAKKGGFKISNAPEGTYTVVAELPGCHPQTITVSVVAGQMTSVNIVLERGI
jgi:hypothetical protein